MQTRILVVGAGSAGCMVVREMQAHPRAGYVPVAFIDDDPVKKGTIIEGIPVAGSRNQIPETLKTTGAEEILIALPSVHGAVIREIVETCRSRKVRFRIVPGIWEIIRGDVHIEQIRKVEPEDLLGRETVEPHHEVLGAAYRGKRVLVTGAGGSIGRELARQIRDLQPEQLILLGRGENSLFESDIAVGPGLHPVEVELALADIRDRDALRRVLDRHRPQVVLHAAAHKHVTFMERYPEEAILNNVVATRDLVDDVIASGAERLVMLSTDKAVNPLSVMGASKRLAELVLGQRNRAGSATRLIAVRFGNVLGSRGSVVPLFQHQIRTGGPVTVSDAEVARYFMTVKEAAMLVLEAGAIGQGGEVFILDMGEQIPIMDLARDLITLSGLRPDIDIPIQITGLKPGEKLREELVHEFETLERTVLSKIQVARRTAGEDPDIISAVERLELLARKANRQEIVRELLDVLPEASLSDDA